MMFPGARSCLNPCLVLRLSIPHKPLPSYHIDALASRLSPHAKDILCVNSTTVGAHRGAPAHGGDEFLEGSLTGIEKVAIGRMKKIRQEIIFGTSRRIPWFGVSVVCHRYNVIRRSPKLRSIFLQSLVAEVGRNYAASAGRYVRSINKRVCKQGSNPKVVSLRDLLLRFRVVLL